MEPLPDTLHLNTPSQEIEMMIQAVKNMNLSKAFVEVSPFFKEYALYMNDYIFYFIRTLKFSFSFDTKIKQKFK